MIEPAPAWLSEVETRLNELLALEENWDTYGALPLEPSHALTAVQLLQYLAPPDAPAPWIVPTTRRGVQLEWHLGDVEIEVRADDSGTQIYVADEAGEDEGDLVRRSDLCGRAALAIAMMTASA